MTDLNMHFKDIHGKHRIVEGNLDMINDPAGLKKMLKAQGITVRISDPILGVIHGSKSTQPSAA